MKLLAFAALAALALAAPAQAQYYPPPPPPGWGPPPPPPPPGWGPPPGYRRPPPPPAYGPPPGPWHRPGRAGVGNICYTSRGECSYPQYFPINTPCRCDIPGFGMKRGAILY